VSLVADAAGDAGDAGRTCSYIHAVLCWGIPGTAVCVGGGGETTRMHTRARRERARERERVRERYIHRQPHALSLSLSLLLSLSPSLSNSLSLYVSFARSLSLSASHLLFLSRSLSRFHAFYFSLAFSPPSLGHTNTHHTHTSHHYILSIDSDVCCTQLCQFWNVYIDDTVFSWWLMYFEYMPRLLIDWSWE